MFFFHHWTPEELYLFEKKVSSRATTALRESNKQINLFKSAIQDLITIVDMLNKLEFIGVRGDSEILSAIEKTVNALHKDFRLIDRTKIIIHQLKNQITKLLQYEEGLYHIPSLAEIMEKIKDKNSYLEEEMNKLEKEFASFENILIQTKAKIKNIRTSKDYNELKKYCTQTSSRLSQRLISTEEIFAHIMQNIPNQYREYLDLEVQFKKAKELEWFEPQSKKYRLYNLKTKYNNSVIIKSEVSKFLRKHGDAERLVYDFIDTAGFRYTYKNGPLEIKHDDIDPYYNHIFGENKLTIFYKGKQVCYIGKSEEIKLGEWIIYLDDLINST
jgi:hypothetical protein